MPSTRTEDEYAARYSALYKEHNAQLVSYAWSLTGSTAMAEDLAAEAHFRVWRRMQAGHEIDNVAAYLTTTVRNLAAGLARAQREVARDIAEMPEDPGREGAAVEDPEHRASHVDLISRLLKELPDRWAKALWYAEVEDLPMEEVGAKIGANAGTTAVVLTRARERLRQAFLLSQPGAPLREECEPYWKHMATIVRGTASARRTRNVTEHCDECDDCRSRMLALTAANTQLPALLGPALLAGVLAGGAWFVPAVAGAGAGVAAGTAAGTAARAGSRAARHARVGVKARIVRHGMSPTKTVVAGSVAAVGIAATVATLALASSDHPTPAAQSALQTHAATIQPTSTSTPASATQGAPTSASAAATQAAASTQSAAATTSAATTAASSAAPTQAASSAAAQSSQPQSSATTAAASASTAASSTAATTATTPPVPSASTSTSTAASPVASDTPTASPSQSSTPAATPTPTPSETGSATPTSDPTCTFDILGLCFGTITGDN